jgi:ABC-2 type transport system permease protein
VNILRKSFDDRRRGFIGWAIGIIALSAFILAFYPSIKSSPQFEEAYKQLPDALRSIVGDVSLTSPAGYLERQLFLYTIPILFFVFSIGHGADAIAGEEQRHTLDLLMSTPVSRARAVVEKFGATFAGLTGLGLVLLLTLVVGTRLVSMDIRVARLAAATVGAVLLGLAVGALALAIGSATGKKGFAVGVASAVATIAYFVNSLAPQIDVLKAIRPLSPFYYYSDGSPLEKGFQIGHFAVLLAITAVLVSIAVAFFDRRDISV